MYNYCCRPVEVHKRERGKGRDNCCIQMVEDCEISRMRREFLRKAELPRCVNNGIDERRV